MSNPEKKIVYVAEKDGCAAEILNGILQFCGREKYIDVIKGTALSDNIKPTVILLCTLCREIKTDDCQCVISEYSLTQDARFSCAKPCKTYSSKTDSADFTARNIRFAQDGFVAFEIVGVGIIGRVKLNTRDSGTVSDALAASAAAVGIGIPFADVLKALNSIELENENL